MFGLLLGYEMPSAVEEHICPVPFLVHDAGKLTAVAEPGRGWTSGEPLNPSEGRVLEGSSVLSVSTNVLVADLDHDWERIVRMSGHVGSEHSTDPLNRGGTKSSHRSQSR